jgi:ABC-type multidrug transport system ATPase subunit
VIEIADVSLSLGPHTVLERFSWRLADPGVYLLLGGNGAGKSLLCQLLAGKRKPQQGRVLIDGAPLYRLLGGYARPVFLAQAHELPTGAMTLEEYLDSQLSLLNAGLHLLKPLRAMLEEAVGQSLSAPLEQFSHGQVLLAQAALAAIAPVRLALLDGHLALLDQQHCKHMGRLLQAARAGEERFIVLATARMAAAVPGVREIFSLAGGLPVRLAAAPEAPASVAPVTGQTLRLRLRGWIPGAQAIASGAAYTLLGQWEEGLRIRINGSLDAALTELSAQGLSVVQIVWEGEA